LRQLEGTLSKLDKKPTLEKKAASAFDKKTVAALDKKPSPARRKTAPSAPGRARPTSRPAKSS
jgi:hypothetical protein